ncbi:hypothetical protein FOCG_11540 [Fusarium oxysporum f. sp. radicis-lycopersici 26381]|uniref:Uncharacterized protein n=2 Tax=Fusarium oxysporum TaxID=5507 RepID=X0NL81_FUSOX|nr:hypothetical protein FOZG_02665 [Fusarium oxysporum Fo47]EWZ84558.1 hypothetical protein FOWG_12327 [Fusarium oxysporum f. sp. lycopersici MN25]EXL47346.1 hypothetical protein FOCG_11540 [Fusarium oxysporum f. sp. radicis-lycopersici 26381]EXM33385.1 hypothetical protein FOTG_02049 [Fusarium oxysporum f. sp. vasinfectum 25433]
MHFFYRFSVGDPPRIKPSTTFLCVAYLKSFDELNGAVPK